MKTRLFKTILALALALIALPMMGQDYMNVYFKNGDFRKFYLKNVTEITTSKLDADGVKHADYDYQHVTTIYDKYVYSLEEVDSITFTKINEELAKQNFVAAMPTVFSTISSSNTIEEIEKKIDIIKNTEGVADAWSDGHQLFVAIAQDEVYSFHINHDENVNSDGYVKAINQVKAMLPQLKTAIKKDGSQLKVVIANQAHKDENRYLWLWDSYLEPLKKKMESCDIRVDYVDEPTVDFFYDHCKNPDTADHLNLYDYDVIFLLTHGSYYNVKTYMYNTKQFVELGIKWHAFITSNDIITVNQSELPSWEDYYFTFKKWRDESSYKDVTDANINFWFQDEKRNDQTVWVAHPALTETFFRYIVQDETKFLNPNSVFFNVACQSLMGEKDDTPSYKLAEEFTKRGLGSYVGYDESNGVGQSAGYHLFINMLNGMSLKRALDNLSDGEKHEKRSRNSAEYFADISIYPQNEEYGSLFLIRPDAEQISNETATSDFNELNSVMLTGTATLLDYDVHHKDGIKVGFALTYNDPVAHTQHINTENVQLLDNNKVEFYVFPENLERNRTYQYCAYTYDGLNYNYGKVYSFKIDKLKDLELSTGSFCIDEGKSTTIDITGNGEYDIFNGNEKVTKVTLEGEKLIIEAIGAGESTIIVTDKKTGKEAKIEVTVWARLSVAIIGNIDLEVGASADVRIMSGNGDYKLESSDPKVATPSLVGELVEVDALSAGTATITVTDNKTGQTASFTVTIAKPAPIDIPAEPINLGLPSGTLWASWNVGATAPEEYGNYYSWGETEVREQYYFTTYSLCDGTNSSCHDIGADISGTQYDVAHVKWSGGWCMPSKDDFMELVYNCEYKETTQNGVKGLQFTGKNGNYIFLPYTGYYWNTENSKVGNEGSYWSSTLTTSRNHAHEMNFSKGEMLWDCYINRFAGLCVRPVKHSSPTYDNLVLSTTSPISLKAGETCAVQIISGNGVYTFDNTNSRVATFEIEGNTITISAVRAGTTIITVKDTKSLQTATIKVTVSGTTNDIPADVIDLGLKSGKKWASYNVGALCPEDFGGYFAWGETETKESYTEDNYIANVDLTKEYITVISGTEHDAARIHWGENWRMPTILEIRELLRECTSKWDTVNGVKGRRFIGPNGNSIFLPAAGAYYAYGNYYEGEDGSYWSAEQVWDGTKAAFYLSFSSTGASGENRSAFDVGMPIRPIYCGDTDHLVDFKLSSIDPVCLPVGESHTIEIMSGNNSYTILSSDESVATVGQGGWASIEQGTSGKSIVISAVATGVSIVTAFDNMSGQKFTIAVKVIDPNSTINIIGHEAVDLGLPSGTLWATNNIGAEKEEDYGEYYAWGETAQKDEYYSHTYDFSADKNDENSCVFLGDIAGTEFDVAHVKWGGLWRMPTHEQVKELIENCESWVTKHNGVTGILFKGPNGKRIFLPAAGFRGNSNIYSQGESSQYWTSTPDATNANTVYTFYTMNIQNPSQVRYLGLSVRPVANNGNDLVNLTLSDDYIRLNVGENGSIDITSGNGHYSVTSSDANIATAKVQSWHSIEKGTSGISIVIDALSVGEATIFVTDNNCGQTRRIEVKIVNINLNGHEAIDLGLTSGTMWATCNVGAASPEEFGGFYAWGETMEKESYSWGTYTHCDGAYSSCHNIGEDISGSEYDVAHVKWGGSWKTPNETQVNELLDECSSEWTSVNDVNGYRFTGPNGKSIFIPAAGYYENSRHYRSGKAGGYWMSSQDSKPNYVSDIIVFEKDYVE